MAARLHQAGQVWPAGETPRARIMFGPHTPTDRAVILDEVVKAYGGGIMSLETGVRMLMDAGYPIEDAPEEIDRIQSRAFAAAGLLAGFVHLKEQRLSTGSGVSCRSAGS